MSGKMARPSRLSLTKEQRQGGDTFSNPNHTDEARDEQDSRRQSADSKRRITDNLQQLEERRPFLPPPSPLALMQLLEVEEIRGALLQVDLHGIVQLFRMKRVSSDFKAWCASALASAPQICLLGGSVSIDYKCADGFLQNDHEGTSSVHTFDLSTLK